MQTWDYRQGKSIQTLTMRSSGCKSFHEFNHYSSLIIGNGNKEAEWDSRGWHIYLCEDVTEYYFWKVRASERHVASGSVSQLGLVDDKITWHVLYSCLWCRYTGVTGGVYVTQDEARPMHIHTHTHTHTLKPQCTHTNSHAAVQMYALSLRVCSFPHHLCFNPSAKILSSKIWLDIFQHWISRESRLAHWWILLERQGKKGEKGGKRLVSQKATGRGRHPFAPCATGAHGGINLMSLYTVINGSPLNDTLCRSVPKKN